MYAIIATGGKQYKVTAGEALQIEKLKAEVGTEVEFDKVLMLVDGEKIEIGAPYLEGVKVVGEVAEQGRGEKIHIIKFRRRKHYMRHQGHRQSFTEVKVKAINN
ncbi:MAG: 50S ribosomal protein L21 [bacterium]